MVSVQSLFVAPCFIKYCLQLVPERSYVTPTLGKYEKQFYKTILYQDYLLHTTSECF